MRAAGRPLGYRLRVEVSPKDTALPPFEARRLRVSPGLPGGFHVAIVGAGPAGLWAALRLTELGVRCTVVEQGKQVQPRRKDLAELNRGRLDETSNYCFGEGGAGTYSDGKLYTRSKDKAGCAAVLADLVQFGAPARIAVDARPHIGSNRLPKVITALREHLIACGVRFMFETTFTGLHVGNPRGTRARSGHPYGPWGHPGRRGRVGGWSLGPVGLRGPGRGEHPHRAQGVRHGGAFGAAPTRHQQDAVRPSLRSRRSAAGVF